MSHQLDYESREALLDICEEESELSDLEVFIKRALYRDPSFKVRKIGASNTDPNDVKFTQHVLNFHGPNWRGNVMVWLVGKAWREKAYKWFYVTCLIYPNDAENGMTEMVADLTPGRTAFSKFPPGAEDVEKLYPVLTAAVDDFGASSSNVSITKDSDVFGLFKDLSLTCISYLRGAGFIPESVSEAFDPDTFDANAYMTDIIRTGGFNPLRWNTKHTKNETIYRLDFPSFDRQTNGSVVLVATPAAGDVDNIDVQASILVYPGELADRRLRLARDIATKRKLDRSGVENSGMMVALGARSYSRYAGWAGSFRCLKSDIDNVKTAYRSLVRGKLRELVDDRDENGQPTIMYREADLASAAVKVFTEYYPESCSAPSLAILESGYEDYLNAAMDGLFVGNWEDAALVAGMPVKVLRIKFRKHEDYEGYVKIMPCPPKGSSLIYTRVTGHLSRCSVAMVNGYGQDLLDDIRTAVIDLSRNSGRSTTASDMSTRLRDAVAGVVKGRPNVVKLYEGSHSNYGEQDDVLESSLEDFWDDYRISDVKLEWQVDLGVQGINHCLKFDLYEFDGWVRFYEDATRVKYMFLSLQDTTEELTIAKAISPGSSAWPNHIGNEDVPDLKNRIENFVKNEVPSIVLGLRGSTISIRSADIAIGRAFEEILIPWSGMAESLEPGDFMSGVMSGAATKINWVYGDVISPVVAKADVKSFDGAHRYQVSVRKKWDDSRGYVSSDLMVSLKCAKMTEDGWRVVAEATASAFLGIENLSSILTSAEAYVRKLMSTYNVDNPMPSVEHSVGVANGFHKAISHGIVDESLEPGDFMSGVMSGSTSKPEWVFREDGGSEVARASVSSWDRSHAYEVTVRKRIVGGVYSDDSLSVLLRCIRSVNDYNCVVASEIVTVYDGLRNINQVVTSVDTYLRHLLSRYSADNPVPYFDGISLLSKSDSIELNSMRKGFRKALANNLVAESENPEDFFKSFEKSRTVGPWMTTVTERYISNVKTVSDAALTGKSLNSFSFFVRYYPKGLFGEDNPETNNWCNVRVSRYDPKGCNHTEFSVMTENYHVILDAVDEVCKKRVSGIILRGKPTKSSFNAVTRDLFSILRGKGLDVLTPMLEGGNKTPIAIHYRNDVKGYHHGQLDMVLRAYVGDDEAGKIEYVSYADEIRVSYIYVSPLYRRRGVATSLAKKLQADNPDTEIAWGYATSDGHSFINSLNTVYRPDMDYARVSLELENARKEYASLQSDLDAVSGPIVGNKDMLLKGERLNELDALIYSLEQILREMKPGKKTISESDEDIVAFMGDIDKMLIRWVPDTDGIEDLGGQVRAYKLDIRDFTGKLYTEDGPAGNPTFLLVRFSINAAPEAKTAPVRTLIAYYIHVNNGSGQRNRTYYDNEVIYTVPRDEKAFLDAVKESFEATWAKTVKTPGTTAKDFIGADAEFKNLIVKLRKSFTAFRL